MRFEEALLQSAILILLSMTILWIISLKLQSASIVDIFWGLGFILINSFVFFRSIQHSLVQWISFLCVTAWGIRLAFHIGKRNWRKPEDFRYAEWRLENGVRWWWISFFKVFMLQGIIMLILSIPMLVAHVSPPVDDWNSASSLGFLLWVFGFSFEVTSDLQLSRFKSNPTNKDQIMTTGLWKYSRHPNYFGEAVLWWGYYFMAITPHFWWTVFSPILMTWLLVRISGVAMLERTMKSRYGYEEYMRQTSSFIPWFQRK